MLFSFNECGYPHSIQQTHIHTQAHKCSAWSLLLSSGINHMNQFDPLVWARPLVHLHTPPLNKYTNYKLLSTTCRWVHPRADSPWS